MTEQTAPARDRLFELIASIPGSRAVDWCDQARALLDEITIPSAGPAPATDRDTLSRRAGLRDEIVKALGRIKTTPPVAHRREQADHVLAVLYQEWPWLRAEAEETATDRDTLRQRIAEAIWERQNPGRRYADCEYRWKADAEADADAVLAVLPAPADQTAVRAAALREAADFVGNDDDCGCGGCDTCVPRQLAAELRRLAGEAQQDEAEADPTERELTADEQVRGVQGWMALDLHQALGRPTDHSAGSAYQGHRSWGDWWADLLAAVRNAQMIRRYRGEAQQDERCTRCAHPKRDHDGRADHRAKHSPLVAGEPWCHACNAECEYELAREAQQDPTQDGAEMCVCGHGPGAHDAKFSDPQCAMCPGDSERSWRHPFTPTAVARPGQPGTDEAEIRCAEAFWTGRPEKPHTWWQSEDHPQRRCPGVVEAQDGREGA